MAATYTIIDATGEIVSQIRLSSASDLAANMRPGCTAIEGVPPTRDAYRAVGAWVERPERPSAAHTWDAAIKQWRDMRPLDVVKRDLSAPLLLKLAAEDGRVIRPLSEIVDALINGQPMPAAAKTALAELLARKDALRQELNAIAALTAEAGQETKP